MKRRQWFWVLFLCFCTHCGIRIVDYTQKNLMLTQCAVNYRMRGGNSQQRYSKRFSKASMLDWNERRGNCSARIFSTWSWRMIYCRRLQAMAPDVVLCHSATLPRRQWSYLQERTRDTKSRNYKRTGAISTSGIPEYSTGTTINMIQNIVNAHQLSPAYQRWQQFFQWDEPEYLCVNQTTSESQMTATISLLSLSEEKSRI